MREQKRGIFPAANGQANFSTRVIAELLRSRAALRVLFGLIVFFSVSSVGLPGVANAKTPAQFYRGKLVHIIVGFRAGGGFDAYARLIAKPLAKRLGATVIVNDEPGAADLRALDELVHSRYHDGLHMMLLFGDVATLSQVLHMPGVKYDMRKVKWLARAGLIYPVTLLWNPTSFHNLKSFTRVLSWMRKGHTTRWADVGVYYVQPMAEALGLTSKEVKIIQGYRGHSSALLAAEQGEINGFATSVQSGQHYIKGRNLTPLVLLSDKGTPLFPNVPTIFSLEHLDKSHSWWLRYRFSISKLGRSFIVPSDTPDARVRYLRKTLRDVLTDPAFVAKASQAGRPIAFLSGKGLKRITNHIFAHFDAKLRKKMRYVYLEKYASK